MVVRGKKTCGGTRRMIGPESRSDHRMSPSSRSTVSDAGRGTDEDGIPLKYITRILTDLILKIWKSVELRKVLKSGSGSKM